MKKLICIALIAAMTAVSITACGNNGTDTTTSAETSADTSAETSAETTTSAEETSAETSAEETTEGDTTSSTDTILTAIRNAYGDNYLPDFAIPAEMLADTYGLTEGMYKSVSAEMPMISVNPDTVIIVEAADGQAEAVAAALNTYRDNKIQNEIQYPMNVAKVNASQVVTNGNFVAFILAGAIDEREDASDEEMAAFAEEQTQIGVDAFNSCF